MDIGQFDLRSLTFEARYKPALRIYDRAGTIWAEIVERMPDLSPVDRNADFFRYRHEHTELMVGLERLHVLHGGEIKTDAFIDQVAMLTDLVPIECSFDTFTRVAVRQVYRRAFPSEEEATEALYSGKMLSRLPAKNFGVEGKPLAAEFVHRVEGEALGFLARVGVQKRTIKVEPPFGELGIERKEETRFEYTYDVDYFTTLDMPVAMFSAPEWIKQILHVVRRDAGELIGK